MNALIKDIECKNVLCCNDAFLQGFKKIMYQSIRNSWAGTFANPYKIYQSGYKSCKNYYQCITCTILEIFIDTSQIWSDFFNNLFKNCYFWSKCYQICFNYFIYQIICQSHQIVTQIILPILNQAAQTAMEWRIGAHIPTLYSTIQNIRCAFAVYWVASNSYSRVLWSPTGLWDFIWSKK